MDDYDNEPDEDIPKPGRSVFGDDPGPSSESVFGEPEVPIEAAPTPGDTVARWSRASSRTSASVVLGRSMFLVRCNAATRKPWRMTLDRLS